MLPYTNVNVRNVEICKGYTFMMVIKVTIVYFIMRIRTMQSVLIVDYKRSALHSVKDHCNFKHCTCNT